MKNGIGIINIAPNVLVVGFKRFFKKKRLDANKCFLKAQSQEYLDQYFK